VRRNMSRNELCSSLGSRRVIRGRSFWQETRSFPPISRVKHFDYLSNVYFSINHNYLSPLHDQHYQTIVHIINITIFAPIPVALNLISVLLQCLALRSIKLVVFTLERIELLPRCLGVRWSGSQRSSLRTTPIRLVWWLGSIAILRLELPSYFALGVKAALQ
jgi:hypothetical protein